jgi:dTDP-4-dehydrorhamnose 3,5-epimerase
MEYYKTEIKNLFLLKFKKKKDKRGFFAEIYNSSKNKKKINLNFLQQNISFSKYKNVFRGMHFQTGNFSQDKLLMVIKGEIDDFIFDLRKNSQTYRKLVKINLKENANKLIYIPKGCAHGFLTKKRNTLIMYSVTKNYNQNSDSGYNYKSLGIKLPRKVIISTKDKSLPFFDI